ncbi:MAG: hypothetical protein KBG85_18235 [Micropruina sp.]|nr:hypothetical protein [Micropruina sp.]
MGLRSAVAADIAGYDHMEHPTRDLKAGEHVAAVIADGVGSGGTTADKVTRRAGD